MKNIFTDHPRSLNETYSQHFCIAFKVGSFMVLGGLACILHAFLPFLFKKTGSNVLINLLQSFIERMPVLEERMIMLSKTIEKKSTMTAEETHHAI